LEILFDSDHDLLSGCFCNFLYQFDDRENDTSVLSDSQMRSDHLMVLIRRNRLSFIREISGACVWIRFP